MKIFIDTANIAAIQEAAAYGIISGVTTNPTLIAKEGRVFEEVLAEITSIVPDCVVFGEVLSMEHEKMVEEALELVKIHPNLEIKIPMCAEGLKAIHALRQKGIRTNCTLIFTAAQALLAARAGASYVSPFVGRLDDIGSLGTDLIADIAQIFDVHGFDCEIIAASTRNPLHVIECAKVGAHIATIPPAVIQQMMGHPLTTIGIERFLKDWDDLQAKL